MALSRVVSEIFNVEKCRDLEIGSKVTHGHSKLYHAIEHAWFPISVLLRGRFVVPHSQVAPLSVFL